jgi:hypothetical protein
MTKPMQMQMVRDRDPRALLAQMESAAQAKGDPLRIRLALTVLDHESKNYTTLPGVSWLMDIATAEGVWELQAGVQLFFEVMETLHGPGAMREYMEQIQAALAQQAREQAKDGQVGG